MEKVLIIDSSQGGAEFIVRCLKKNGFEVIHLPDTVGLQHRVVLSSVDLIILDAVIKGESGFDACKRLKMIEDARYTPVLMLGTVETGNSTMRAMEAGADDYMVKTSDENALLSRTKSLLRIKGLSDQLIKQYTELENKNKLLDQQLEMAKSVQQSLIHEYDITQNNVRIVTRYMPALQIGGDFYDIIKLDEENVSIVLGDVSGHGISAALLTAMLTMMIRNIAPKYYNPAQFLRNMNAEFMRIFDPDANNQMYAAMFYAVINTKKKRINFSNAGHTLPIFVNREAGLAYEPDIAGPPIGFVNEPIYEHKLSIYDKGDMILFFTDGLADNLYRNDYDEFGRRIRNILLGAGEFTEPTHILDSIADMFTSPKKGAKLQFELDDVSMVLCTM